MSGEIPGAFIPLLILADRMRQLADAVEPWNRPAGGVPFQPIYPATLREWADTIEATYRGQRGPGCAMSDDRPRPLLMGSVLKESWCCLKCEAVFGFGEHVGVGWLRCPECRSEYTCSVEGRDWIEAQS